MRVTVEFYGVLRQLAGCENIVLDLSGTTVAEALHELCKQQPGLNGHLPRIACAVGDNLVQRQDKLQEDDVLALIPPVSGGTA